MEEPETPVPREEPYIEFNSFEGSYTSNSLYAASGMYLCVDRNNQLSGSYDEIGIMQGFVENFVDDEDRPLMIASGEFYEAGNSKYI